MDGPTPTVLHRWVGYHAPALRRLTIAAVIGLVAVALAAPFVRWEVAVLVGWDGAALAFLGRCGRRSCGRTRPAPAPTRPAPT